MNDPNFAQANSNGVKNILGWFGANLSEFLLSLNGVGYALLATIFIILGFKKLTNKLIWDIGLRFAAFIFLILFSGAFFVHLDFIKELPNHWPYTIDTTYRPIKISHGGLLGSYIYRLVQPSLGEIFYFIITFAGTFFLFNYAAFISLRSYAKLALLFIPFRWLFIKIKGKDEQVIEVKPKKNKKPKTTKAKATNKKASTKKKSVKKKRRTPYELPSIEMLKIKKVARSRMNEAALFKQAEKLEKVLTDFKVKGEISAVSPGPVVTLYSLQPAAGTKSSRVTGLSDDIARSMSSVSARVAVIPGKNLIGIELPNQTRETVFLKEIIESEEFEEHKGALPIALGKNIGGDAVIADLAKTPHLLVAGTTGSGKSVGINAMIMSLLYKFSPEEVKFIMIDPKMLELSVYDGIPHLLTEVVTDPATAVTALKWVVKEMENRYRLMSNISVRNIAGYNEKIAKAVERGEVMKRTVQTGFDSSTGQPIMEDVDYDMTPLPHLVVVVDEYADLMVVAGKEVEQQIQRLSQMARAAGIHIILGTQRPSVDVVTGVIKSNFPSRISYKVSSKVDSRTILNEQGGEALLGNGDMLFMGNGTKIERVHGPFVSDEEVNKVVKYLKTQGEPEYIDDITAFDDGGGNGAGVGGQAGSAFGDGGEGNSLYNQAVAAVVESGKPSISYIQRKLRIGYNKAATLMEELEQAGVVSAPDHQNKRTILLK